MIKILPGIAVAVHVFRSRQEQVSNAEPDYEDAVKTIGILLAYPADLPEV